MQPHHTSDFPTTALRLLRQVGAVAWRAARQAGRWLEWLFVHRLMRMAVDSYDKRHGRQPGYTPSGENDATATLREQLTRTMAERNDLANQQRYWQQQANDAKSVATHLKQECDRLTSSLDKLSNENACLHDKLTRLSTVKADYERLAATTASASMLLYAEADASEPCLRKTTMQPVHATQYVLTTQPGNPDNATFRIYEKTDHAHVIANRSVALLACDVKSIAASPSRIVNIEPGTAHLENSTWRVIKKAVIHIE